MKTINLDKAEIVKNPHDVKSQKLHSSEHISLMLLTFKPGETLRQHITPVARAQAASLCAYTGARA